MPKFERKNLLKVSISRETGINWIYFHLTWKSSKNSEFWEKVPRIETFFSSKFDPATGVMHIFCLFCYPNRYKFWHVVVSEVQFFVMMGCFCCSVCPNVRWCIRSVASCQCSRSEHRSVGLFGVHGSPLFLHASLICRGCRSPRSVLHSRTESVVRPPWGCTYWFHSSTLSRPKTTLSS